jgi:hypothetical protein
VDERGEKEKEMVVGIKLPRILSHEPSLLVRGADTFQTQP